jgi:SprT protein
MMKDLQEGLRPYLPGNSLEPVMNWIDGHRLILRIARGRRTKLGDYRPPVKDSFHRISVNRDLNPYEFLITLTHEIAHLDVWVSYGKRAKPHGKAWKKQYSAMLTTLLDRKVFPEEIETIIRTQVSHPKASSKGSTDLVRALHIHNPEKDGLFLEDLPQGAAFSLLDGRKFRKMEKLRKWYRCMSLDNRKPYRISPVARVLTVEE